MDKISTRKLYKSVRSSLSSSERAEFDKRIFARFANFFVSDQYNLYLIYVSVGDEADTLNIINYLLNNNKRVAVPVCNDKDMFFYEIRSLDELCAGKFGIPTVNTDLSEKIDEYKDAICIVPGICFDNYGNRIGYGGGYYDRFLSANPVKTVGLCYERCMCNSLPSENFDKSVDYILTESCLRNSKCKEVSTYE